MPTGIFECGARNERNRHPQIQEINQAFQTRKFPTFFFNIRSVPVNKITPRLAKDAPGAQNDSEKKGIKESKIWEGSRLTLLLVVSDLGISVERKGKTRLSAKIMDVGGHKQPPRMSF